MWPHTLGMQEFTNQLFQLANPLAAAKPVAFNSGGDDPGYCRLDDKYVQNLLSKCQEQVRLPCCSPLALNNCFLPVHVHVCVRVDASCTS